MSDTMTEGVVVKWHKKIGDTIKNGDLVAEIETDKATMEFESYQAGTLLYTGIEEGKAAPVDSILAILGKAGEDYKPLLEQESAPKAEPVKAETPKKQEVEASKPAAIATPVVPVAAPAPLPTQPVHTSDNGHSDTRTKASPLARRLAAERGIDLSMLQGSGGHGRIVKRDVQWFKPGSYIQSATLASRAVSSEQFEETPVSQMRKTIARRLSESMFTAPHFYLTMDIDMDEVVRARESVNAVTGVKVSYNDFVVKAAATALREHPAVNSSWLGDKIRTNHHVHIGVAVAVDEGLLVPVVRFADGKTLSQIAAEVKGFAQKAKEKKLQPQDWEGNTFTISNLGMYNLSLIHI